MKWTRYGSGGLQHKSESLDIVVSQTAQTGKPMWYYRIKAAHDSNENGLTHIEGIVDTRKEAKNVSEWLVREWV